MANKPDFDSQVVHRFFAATCFNKAWELIEKSDRTPEEDEEMIRLGLASTWHWTQRDDCTKQNMSIAYWQTSRIYSILGQAGNARRYAQLCLDISQEGQVPPFYLGYAYEALARAELVAGNQEMVDEYLHHAQAIATALTNENEKKMLEEDLERMQ